MLIAPVVSQASETNQMIEKSVWLLPGPVFCVLSSLLLSPLLSLSFSRLSPSLFVVPLIDSLSVLTLYAIDVISVYRPVD